MHVRCCASRVAHLRIEIQDLDCPHVWNRHFVDAIWQNRDNRVDLRRSGSHVDVWSMSVRQTEIGVGDEFWAWAPAQ